MDISGSGACIIVGFASSRVDPSISATTSSLMEIISYFKIRVKVDIMATVRKKFHARYINPSL